MTSNSSKADTLFIHSGLYEVSEAARIVNVTAHLPESVGHITNRHVIRWIRKGLALPRLGEVHGNELLLSFEDLISMRVIALLRAVGIAWSKIYMAEKWLRLHTGSERPFASEALWTAGREVFMDYQGSLIAASMGGQFPFPELLNDYLIPVAGMTFSIGGLPLSWEPQSMVILRPSVQFGAPCVKGTRITTEAIASMFDAGDSEELIARVYDITVDAVREAIKWESRLLKAA